MNEVYKEICPLARYILRYDIFGIGECEDERTDKCQNSNLQNRASAHRTEKLFVLFNMFADKLYQFLIRSEVGRRRGTEDIFGVFKRCFGRDDVL